MSGKECGTYYGESEVPDMNLDLRCPACGFSINVYLPDGLTAKELKMAKACPCGRQMETENDRRARMRKGGIEEAEFYTLIFSTKQDGTREIIALKKNGIRFEKNGMTFYAYQGKRSSTMPECHIIDPETGCSIGSVNCTLDAVKRHAKHGVIEKLKAIKSARTGIDFVQYEKCKKAFADAPRVEAIEEEGELWD